MARRIEMSKRTVLAVTTGQFGTTRKLVHRTAGHEVAGSGMREVGEAWGSLFEDKNGNGGQWFKTRKEAADHFNQRVSKTKEN